ncbi:hypothetical protein B0H67DRAFT_112225 [Lasiosphaeris hirsuta]|uniref:Uncharacterized protein n=1 Tax=Lasiosphaeris hirsuta TaxID=260670 RepID=A0AA40AZ95_9PEZI|nr:hypothetical protein B0H67DRAFT_112225 [Lasiosphaeris hirsuta]
MDWVTGPFGCSGILTLLPAPTFTARSSILRPGIHWQDLPGSNRLMEVRFAALRPISLKISNDSLAGVLLAHRRFTAMIRQSCQTHMFQLENNTCPTLPLRCQLTREG